jgi:hypothetical protein
MPYFAPIRQDEYPATDELQCIAVHIPAGDEYKALLAGFIAFLTDVYSYEDPESAQADGVAAVFDEGYAQTNWDGCDQPPECEPMSSETLLLLDTAVIVSGAAQVWTADSAQSMAGYWIQGAGATGDAFFWDRYLASGAWYFEMTYVRNTNQGKADFYISNSLTGTVIATVAVDQYGTLARNMVATLSATLPENGLYRITVEGTGKNAASSGFLRAISRVSGWRS